jgi:light-regulated signal transduction histidine kinase (bacteriophytochrome)
MDELVESLLKLSRVARSDLSHSPVDLSCLAGLIAAELKASEPSRDVAFHISPDLRASGDEQLLKLVLENLLRNAWKFTSKRSAAKIEFGVMEAPEKAFFVRDNGAGFDPSYGGRLFGAFQRLHSPAEFPGVGVGLAIVQRIINRHGGRIWADAAVERGATFYFVLPENETR